MRGFGVALEQAAQVEVFDGFSDIDIGVVLCDICGVVPDTVWSSYDWLAEDPYGVPGAIDCKGMLQLAAPCFAVDLLARGEVRV